MLNKLRNDHLVRGEKAEQQALEYLLRRGLRLVTRNYRCKNGELDLVMMDGQILVIVEVRFRQSDRYGGALESITSRKQSRIISATEHYLMHHTMNHPIRFDVVAISGDQTINWIKNAFHN